MSRTHRRMTLAAVAACAFAFALPAAAQTKEPVKICFVYVSPVSDAGWTHQHDIARIAMEKNLAGKVTTKYIESVPEGADAERVIRELAQSGHKLIFTTSFGYMDPTLKVAKKYPNVHFEHATGYKRAKNMSTYSGRFYEGRYIQGVIAASYLVDSLILLLYARAGTQYCPDCGVPVMSYSAGQITEEIRKMARAGGTTRRTSALCRS